MANWNSFTGVLKKRYDTDDIGNYVELYNDVTTLSLDIDSYNIPLMHLITGMQSRGRNTEFELDENAYQ